MKGVERPLSKIMQKYKPSVLGRPLSPEVLAIFTNMLKTVKKNPGISNVELSGKLGIRSLQCSTLGKRLEAQKELKIVREGRAIFYHPVDND